MRGAIGRRQPEGQEAKTKPQIQQRRRPAMTAKRPVLEHDPEKWKPAFGKDHAPTRNLDLDPIQSNWIKV
jgi:hypothetical protein